MSNQGGDLFDMAKDGTKIPKNAAKPRVIPSVANPADQNTQALDAGANDVVTAQGEVLPESVEQKASGNGGKEDDYTPAPKGGRNH
ncbi:hypothetical protein LIA77_05250 [Sarocladium implicatum]|nr:hypothetical protein LIA77_05250 [Sarocladium implicatum]